MSNLPKNQLSAQSALLGDTTHCNAIQRIHGQKSQINRGSRNRKFLVKWVLAVCRNGSAYGIRTRVPALRGPCPRPLDECALKSRQSNPQVEADKRQVKAYLRNMELTLYIKPWCPWCIEAVAWLERQGYQFNKIDVLSESHRISAYAPHFKPVTHSDVGDFGRPGPARF